MIQQKIIGPSTEQGPYTVFEKSVVVKLGIQGPAGATFSIESTDTPIELGPYGIWEIDLSELNSRISNLYILDLKGGRVIVDYVEEGSM